MGRKTSYFQGPPNRSRTGSPRRVLLWMTIFVLAVFVFSIELARAQQAVTYSIDYQSPTISILDSLGGVPITEGDILGPLPPMAPGPPPMIVISGGFPNGLGLPMHPAAIGHQPGFPGAVEVDALSFGRDTRIDPDAGIFPLTWVFSVDEFGIGMQGPVPPVPPNVSTEGPVTYPVLPPPGHEASADLFSYFPPGVLTPGIYPIGPGGAPPGNIDLLDGDGLGPLGPFSLGLNFEPNYPSPGPFDAGDNLDAADLETYYIGDYPLFPVYYSLDFPMLDWIEGIPGTASASANGGFVGGDVLVSQGPGAPPLMFAPAPLLGLDLLVPDSDDLDALVLWENGNGVYDPPTDFYSWSFADPTDMLFFSVRRGSAIIGMPDSIFGVPISEGDILIPPFPGAPIGTPPGIWVAAETLGLCTIRSGGCPVMPWAPAGQLVNDDLDALDIAPDCDDDGIPDVIWILQGGSIADCNQNGIPDACDIANGTSQDCQPNGIPDECDIDPTDPDGDGLVSPDCNFNGVPDECDLANGCLHDADGDGIPDECECPSDIDGNGTVNVVDLLKLLGDWGPCP